MSLHIIVCEKPEDQFAIHARQHMLPGAPCMHCYNTITSREAIIIIYSDEERSRRYLHAHCREELGSDEAVESLYKKSIMELK